MKKQPEFDAFDHEMKHTSQLLPTCPKCLKEDLQPILEGREIVDCECGTRYIIRVTYRYTTREVKK